MIRTARLWLRGGALALALAAMGAFAQAQQAPPGLPTKVSPPAGKEAAQGPDAALQRRVEQLEEQLVDLQVTIGTLESLARGTSPPPSRPPPTAGLGAADAGRLDAIETQIKALTAQLEHLQDQVRSLAERAPGPPPSGFGAVTVAPTPPKDEIDRVFPPAKGEPPPPPPKSEPPPPKAEPPPREAAPKPPPSVADNDPPPQHLYERAYGYLLQRTTVRPSRASRRS
jgi:TolA-binding protein